MAAGRKPFGELELDEPDDRHLVLAKSIVRRRLRHADRFADDREQLEGDLGPIAHLLERLGGEAGNPFEARCVEEVERQGSALDRSRHVRERDPGILERLRHQQAAHIAGRQTILVSGNDDAQIDQSIDVLGLDPRSLGRSISWI